MITRFIESRYLDKNGCVDMFNLEMAIKRMKAHEEWDDLEKALKFKRYVETIKGGGMSGSPNNEENNVR